MQLCRFQIIPAFLAYIIHHARNFNPTEQPTTSVFAKKHNAAHNRKICASFHILINQIYTFYVYVYLCMSFCMIKYITYRNKSIPKSMSVTVGLIDLSLSLWLYFLYLGFIFDFIGNEQNNITGLQFADKRHPSKRVNLNRTYVMSKGGSRHVFSNGRTEKPSPPILSAGNH